jgi:hypothetical protein
MASDNARETKVVRYFKAEQNTDGSPVPGTEDLDIWIDVELMTSFIMESGAGVTFRRDTWILDWDLKNNDTRVMKWMKIYQDEENDKETYVVVPIPQLALFETGEGITYRRFTLLFDNSNENEIRTVDTVRIYHAEFGSGETIDVDRDNYLDVEVIKGYSEDTGAGVSYVLEKWLPLSGPIPMKDKLPEGQYEVREKPEEQGELKVWPSAREIIKRGPQPIG